MSIHSKNTVKSEIVLAGDIGGTNARFALFVGSQYQADTFRAIPVANYKDLSDVIAHYSELVDQNRIDQASFSVASTAEFGDAMELTNADMKFSVSALRRRFDMQRVKVVNDFTAAALGMVCIADDSFRCLHKGQAEAFGPRAVIGPGTGLGVSGLFYTGDFWMPLQGQGGHVTVGAETARGLQILQHVATRYGHVSAERYLSGAGIVELYSAICAIDGKDAAFESAADIAAAAIENQCAVSTETLSLFCDHLGLVTGDLALTLGATGGIYLAGGILPKLGNYFIESGFVAKVHHKGRFSSFVQAMPIQMVVGGEPALHGAYTALLSHYDSLGHSDSQ